MSESTPTNIEQVAAGTLDVIELGTATIITSPPPSEEAQP